VLYIVLPLALVFVAVAVLAFVWATKSGQFDDVETPGVRMLYDDEGGAKEKPPGERGRGA